MQTIQKGNQIQVENSKKIFSLLETTYCPFCYKPINIEYKNELIKNINRVLNKDARNHTEELKNFVFPVITFDTAKYANLNNVLCQEISEQIDNCNKIINIYQEKINLKAQNIYKNIKTDNLHLLEEIKKLNDLFLNLEKSRLDFITEAKLTKNNRDKLIDLNMLITSKRLEENFKTYRKQFNECEYIKKQFSIAMAQRESTEKQIAELKQKKENVDIAVKSINKSLEYVFFSKDRLSIEFSNNLYYLKSNNHYVKPKDVSSGERNIIALCYFFTQIMNHSEIKDLYKQELLLIIDDPISSFDFENKVGIISYINARIKKLISKNTKSKAIILTHDLSSAFDLQRAFYALCKASNNKKWELTAAYFELQNKSLKTFEKRRSEYTELLKFIFNYAKSSKNDGSLEIGNYMRRVFESFVTFNYKKDLNIFTQDEKILKLLGDKSNFFETFLSRLLLNNESHYEEQIKVLRDNNHFFKYFSDSEKKKTAKILLCLLYTLNPSHVIAHLEGEKDAKTKIKLWYKEIPTNLDKDKM